MVPPEGRKPAKVPLHFWEALLSQLWVQGCLYRVAKESSNKARGRILSWMRVWI